METASKYKYGISTNKSTGYMGKTATYSQIFLSGTTYYVKTRAKDNAGNGYAESAVATSITQSLGTCSMCNK